MLCQYRRELGELSSTGVVCILYCPSLNNRYISFPVDVGSDAKPATFPSANAFDSSSYSAYLLAKLAKLQDLVATNATPAVQQQKNYYDKNSSTQTFSVREPV